MLCVDPDAPIVGVRICTSPPAFPVAVPASITTPPGRMERLRRHEDDPDWLKSVERVVVTFESELEARLASIPIVDRTGTLSPERRGR